MPVISLGVSVVVFQPDLSLLARTLVTLGRAIGFSQRRFALEARLWIVDNTAPSRGMASQIDEAASKALGATPGIFAETIRGHGNVGFGRGHNLAIARSKADYHLVLNPDVELEEDALFEALQYMQSDLHTGLLAPQARDGKGASLHLCKAYPAVLDLLVRGFAPRRLAALCQARIARYELRELVARGMPAQVPLASGCFMLFRKPVLERLGGFAPEYFLYFEDYDASLRASRISKVTYVPSVRIVHHGGNAARKGLRHVRLFCASALRFYRSHGWKLV